MNTIKLLTHNNVWTELTNSVKRSRVKSIIAVAYFGQNGAKMLPLRKGSILLVDASMSAIKQGQTCPDELLKLYNKGVHIFSLECLHAKLFIIGTTLYCGSSNVSGNSAKRLKETLLKTNNKTVVADAKAYINSFCKMELGNEELFRLSKFYNPPKFFGNTGSRINGKAEFHVCILKIVEYSDDEEVQAEKGREIANKKRETKSRHKVDEFIWSGELRFKKGDTILQITKEDNKSYLSPIGKLIYIRKWSNGNKTKFFCFLEVPNKRRKNLEVVSKKLNEWDTKLLNRGGKKNAILEENIKALWN